MPARCVSKSGDVLDLRLQNGSSIKVTKSKDEPCWALEPSSLDHLEDDMVMCDTINEAMCAYDVKERYKKDEIYTWVGASHTVLVAINPFKRLPLYGLSLMHEFAKPAPNRLLPSVAAPLIS